MDRLIKRERGASRRRGEGQSIFRAYLVGLGVFFLVGVLLTLLMAAVAYGQKDPNAYLFLGRLCPYLAAVSAGAVGGRLQGEKPWLAGGVIGALAVLILWLLSAGVTRESGTGISLIMYLCVAVSSVLGSLILGKPRILRRHRANHRRRF